MAALMSRWRPSNLAPYRPEDTPDLFFWQASGIVLLVVCLAVRSWQVLSQPGLFMEDAVLFKFYYGHKRPFLDVFHSHTGQRYLNVVSDLLAWIYAWCDVRWQPHLYQWTGFVFAVLSAAAFSFSGLIRSRVMLIITPLLLGLIGLNHIFYFNTLIYVMYTSVLIALVLLVYPPPKSVIAFLVQACALVVLPWGGPYSVLVLPAVLLLAVFEKTWSKRVLFLLAFCSTLVYFTTVTGNTTRLANMLRPWVVETYFSTLLDKVITFDLLPPVSLGYWAVVAALILLLAVLLRRDEEYLRSSLVALMLVAASVALFYLSAKLPVYIRPKPCHLVTAHFFWLVFIALSADRLLTAAQVNRWWQGLAVVPFFVLIVHDNSKHPEKRWVEPELSVNAFTAVIRHYEQQALADKKQALCLLLPVRNRFMMPKVLVGDPGPNAYRVKSGDPGFEVGSHFICPTY